MMAARKKKPEDKNTDTLGSTRSIRADAEEKNARSKKSSSDLKGQTPEKLIHELQVHQIDLETQAEELIKAKLALEESREKYLDLYDFAPVGYLTLTDKELITEVNLAGASLLGVERSKLVKARFKKFVTPQDYFGWNRYFASVLKNEKKLDTTLVLIKGDGSTFTARLESIRLTGSSDSPTTVRVAISDITDIWQLETLRESEERFRTILHAMQFGIVIINAQTHTILDANHQALEIIGGSNDDVIGKVCHHFICPAEPGRCPVTDLGETVDSCESFLFNLRGKKRFILKNVIKTSLGGKDVLIESFVDITERKTVEKRIRWLASFPELNPNPIIEMDAQGTITFANAATNTTLLNLALPENPKAFVPEDISEILRVLQKGTQPQIYREITLNNETFAENIALDKELNVARIYTSNITERKQKEEALKKSEEKYRMLIEQTDEGVWIVGSDYKTTFVNNRLAAMFGYTPQEMIGKQVREFMPAEDMEVHSKRMRERLEGKGDRFEQKFLRKDGSVIWVIASVTPLGDENGFDGAFAMLADITERKKAEAELQESSDEVQLLLNSTAEAIYGMDMQGLCTLCNIAGFKILGYERADQLLGRNLHNLIHHMHADGSPYPINDCPIIKAVQCGEGTHVDDEVFWRADGTSFPAEYWSYPITKEGNVVGAVVTLFNITERKRAEVALQQANKKLTLLSSITRHDINNQLTLLMGYLTIIEKKQLDPTFNEYFGKVSTAAQRISSMIQFTKEYEKIGVNAPVWQDCHTLVETAAKEAPLGKIVVKNDFPAGADVFADPLIVKVFYNLMDNTVRYSGKITTIRFSIDERDGNQIIVCEDDGEGVVTEEKEKIFERGFGKNTGLGLALVREILDITGITIKETGEPGKGARFEMMVPKEAWRMTGKGD